MEGYFESMVLKRVAFFLATTTLCWTLTLDSLMRRGLPLVNRCMCHCIGESMDPLLHFDVAHALWVKMFQIFGDQQVLLISVSSLLFCWRYWLGKYRSDIWNLVPGCLMWIVQTEWNRCLFEDTENSLDHLKELSANSI